MRATRTDRQRGTFGGGARAVPDSQASGVLHVDETNTRVCKHVIAGVHLRPNGQFGVKITDIRALTRTLQRLEYRDATK